MSHPLPVGKLTLCIIIFTELNYVLPSYLALRGDTHAFKHFTKIQKCR